MIGKQDDQIYEKIDNVQNKIFKKVEKNQDLLEFYVDLKCQNSILLESNENLLEKNAKL